MSGKTYLPRPDRLRTIQKPFAWIPFSLLKDGLFAEISDRAKLLYLFLCLAADRQGLSFYGDAKILSYFQLDQTEFVLARNELIQKDLVAYDGRLYQVLSLPSSGSYNTYRIKRGRKNTTAEPELFRDIFKRLAQADR